MINRWLLYGALAMGLFAAVASRSHADDTPPTEDAAPALDVVVDRVNREGLAAVRELWPILGLSAAIFEGLAADASIVVQRQAVDLDGSGTDEVILQLADPTENRWQFVAMAELDGAVRTRGSIELHNQKGRQPSLRIEAAESGRRWLVLQSLGSSGSGYERRVETWHHVEDESLPMALEFPFRGSVSGHGLAFNRTFSGSLLDLKDHDDGSVVEVEFTARYTNGEAFSIDGLDELFTRIGTVRYRRNSDETRFTLNEAASDFTEAEIVGFFADDEQGFLQHNFAQLRDLASNGSAPQRDWLLHFLERVDECSEKSILKSLLGDEADEAAAP